MNLFLLVINRFYVNIERVNFIKEQLIRYKDQFHKENMLSYKRPPDLSDSQKKIQQF